jgi:cytochrome c-type biogenesis protein CcmH
MTAPAPAGRAAGARPTLVLVGAVAAVAGVLAAGVAAPAHSAPTLDDQVYAIARELMCPVCTAQTVAESDAELARQMRAEIRARLERGQSREEIIAYFVAQFGDGVLAAPPARGLALLLWAFPAVAVAAGAVVVWAFVRRHLRRPGAAPAPLAASDPGRAGPGQHAPR